MISMSPTRESERETQKWKGDRWQWRQSLSYVRESLRSRDFFTAVQSKHEIRWLNKVNDWSASICVQTSCGALWFTTCLMPLRFYTRCLLLLLTVVFFLLWYNKQQYKTHKSICVISMLTWNCENGNKSMIKFE